MANLTENCNSSPSTRWLIDSLVLGVIFFAHTTLYGLLIRNIATLSPPVRRCAVDKLIYNGADKPNQRLIYTGEMNFSALVDVFAPKLWPKLRRAVQLQNELEKLPK